MQIYLKHQIKVSILHSTYFSDSTVSTYVTISALVYTTIICSQVYCNIIPMDQLDSNLTQLQSFLYFSTRVKESKRQKQK